MVMENIQLGPFDTGDGNWVLWIKMCEQTDCLLDVFIRTPNCDKKEQRIENDFYVFPNPFNNVINISWDSNNEVTHLMVSDEQGSMIFYQYILGSDSFLSFSTENYPKGIYYISLFNNEKLFMRYPVIKNF